MAALQAADIDARAPDGALVARLRITARQAPSTDPLGQITAIDPRDAAEHGESSIQLCEGQQYEYRVEPVGGGRDLRLRCSLSRRFASLGERERPDAGLIETRSFCGTLLLELVDGAACLESPPVATALVDVRSLKVDYRTQYRGMLRRIAAELVELVADIRQSTKVTLAPSFERRTAPDWLQVQVELLRETLDSNEFSAAVQRLLSYPHEALSEEVESVPIGYPIRWNRASVHGLLTSHPRREVPPSHPLRTRLGIPAASERVATALKRPTVDTTENRFAKRALRDFSGFLSHAETIFRRAPGWEAPAALSHRLGGLVEQWLGHSLFRTVGDAHLVPLGSPVLQKRAGYRDILRAWLRFNSAVQLSWDGGEDLFRAGQRDVATLYEYWLFFELLGWFVRKCAGGARPPVESLVEGLGAGSPCLRLRQHVELGPFSGTYMGMGRRLNARFAYNRAFRPSEGRDMPGSWTRCMRPDYTFTFWPEGMEEQDAERQELLVHVHFDAKYRVEDITGLFGTEDSDDTGPDAGGNYKRQDLLKMHAYRDAIKRSQGAYVLYPGRPDSGRPFRGFFHEVLPGLGAFAVAPAADGSAIGMTRLQEFLDDILAHLSNRTTAQERVSYHVSESYMLREPPVPYGAIELPEKDEPGSHRALPPAEAMVLVAWYETAAQRDLAGSPDGFCYVRMGARRGALRVTHELGQVRHVLLHSYGGSVAPGLLELRESGYEVLTRRGLRDRLRKHAKGAGVAAWQASAAADEEELIYALFSTRLTSFLAGHEWNKPSLRAQIMNYEAERRQSRAASDRDSARPNVISLRELLKECS